LVRENSFSRDRYAPGKAASADLMQRAPILYIELLASPESSAANPSGF